MAYEYEALALTNGDYSVLDSSPTEATPELTYTSFGDGLGYQPSGGSTFFPETYASPDYQELTGYNPALDWAPSTLPTSGYESYPVNNSTAGVSLPPVPKGTTTPAKPAGTTPAATGPDLTALKRISEQLGVLADSATDLDTKARMLSQQAMVEAKIQESEATYKSSQVASAKLELDRPNYMLEGLKLGLPVATALLGVAYQDYARRKSEKRADEAEQKIDERLANAATEQEQLAAQNDQLVYQSIKDRQAFADKAWGMVSF